MRILALDGGGARGLITAKILNNYELKYKVDLRNTDIFSGTSTGAIIAGLLACRYSTEDIVKFYVDYGGEIFNKGFLRSNLVRSKYDDRVLNELLDKYLKDVTFGDLRNSGVDLVIPAYNTTTMDRVIFRAGNTKYDYSLVREAVRASASAPTYFDPTVINGDPYIDGGLVMNNPSLVTLLYCKNELKKDVTEILSVGTGRIEKPISEKQLKRGVLFNVNDLFNLQLTEQAQTTTFFTEGFSSLLNYKFQRIEPEIKFSSGEIDDFSSKNIKNMIKDADATKI